MRPSLLAPLLVEQAKAMALAKEIAGMRPDDLERELDNGGATPAPAASPAAVGAPPVALPRQAATLWEDASTLRRLLFSPNAPMPAVALHPVRELAHQRMPASIPAPRSRRRRRR